MTARRSGSMAQSITATVAALAFLYFFRGVLVPLVLALFLAGLVHALLRFIGSRSPGAPHWAILSLVAMIVIAGAASVFLVVGQGAAGLVHEAPRLVDRIDATLLDIGRALGLSRPLQLASISDGISLPQVAGSAAASLGGVLSALILIVTYFGFIMVGRPRVRQRLAKLSTTGEGANRLDAVIERIVGDVQTYLWVQTVTGLIIAGSSWLVMAAIGLDNALFWTVILFLLCYIPIIGVTVGSVVPALFALLQFSSWWQAAVIFAGIQLAATIVGNFIYPRMQAQTQNIDPVATLFAIAFWGFLWGIVGAFLAVPLTLIVMMICAQFPRTRWFAILLSNDGNPDFPGSRKGAAV
ncbi:MAG: AI-2E family transporter [Sphingomonas sp.]|nr:AI-2E family transporter [Sphingomonas sp.]